MSLKRPYQYIDSESSPSSSSLSKRSRYRETITPGSVCKPRRKYPDHPRSGVGKNFHGLPYPLSLLPYDSWDLLHHGTDGESTHSLKCPKCNKELTQPTSYQHKLFLVAERLSWPNGGVSYKQRERNERLNWEVNYQLGIVEPAVEEDVQELGGTRSRTNPWNPFQTEQEMEAAMSLIMKATILSESSWKVWLDMTEAALPLPPDDTTKSTCESPYDSSLANSGQKASAWNSELLGEVSNKRRGGALKAPQLSTPPSSSSSDLMDCTTRPACLSTGPTPGSSLNSHSAFSRVPVSVLDRLLQDAETNSDLRQLMSRLKGGREYSTDEKKFERIWKQVECSMKLDQSNSGTSGPHSQIHTFNPPHASASVDSDWAAYRSAVRNPTRKGPLQDFVERCQKDFSCPSKCLAGMQFAFRGRFDTFTQDEGKSLVSKHGGTVNYITSQSTDYIVLGRGVKLADFKNLWPRHIKMIGEVEFYQLLPCLTGGLIKTDPPTTMANFTTLKLSFRTLSEFYSMLDKIERTSYVGARYLEAYAEYLQNTDSCSNCWFEKRIMSEEELEELEEEIKQEMGEE